MRLVLALTFVLSACGSVVGAEDAGNGGDDGGGGGGGDGGDGFDCDPCAFGCNAAGTGCADILPANGLAAALDQAGAQGELNLPAGATLVFDTDAGTFSCDPAVACDPSAGLFVAVAQSDAPDIAAFAFRSLVIQEGATVQAIGERALALVVEGDVDVGGTLDLRPMDAENVFPSPFREGTAPGGLPAEPTTNGVMVGFEITSGSGGGGGLGGTGGRGGSGRTANNQTVAGAGAGAAVDAPALSPLVGGRRGGNTEDGACDLGGGGGGAIQIVSRTRIEVGPTGVINAGGAGGAGDFCGGPQVGGGGGGGAVLLEAAVVVLGGAVAANGGGGGSRDNPVRGQSGRPDAEPAEGAPTTADAAGGGAGAAGATGPGNGQDASSSGRSGGGGGGGAGRVRVHTAQGGLTLGADVVVSPALAEGAVTIRD